MINKKVWRPVHKSTLSAAERRTILNSLAFFKQKYHPDGSPDRVKARLVAGGHMQDETLFFDSQTRQAGKFHSPGQRQFRQDSRMNQPRLQMLMEDEEEPDSDDEEDYDDDESQDQNEDEDIELLVASAGNTRCQVSVQETATEDLRWHQDK
jgi:hypothetical protein